MRWNVFVAVVLALTTASGCLGADGGRLPRLESSVLGLDVAIQRPADPFFDVAGVGTYLERSARIAGGAPTAGALAFHSFDQVEAKIQAWNDTYPDLVDVNVIGHSRQGRPIYDVVLTNESYPPHLKRVPLLDGAHHGNEYAGGELMLYTIDAILKNHARNATIRELLRDLEIHVVPIVNPDGWVAGTRYNGFGVNLNRNYDLDWGDVLGTSNPLMGRVGAASGQAVGGVALVAENCGATAFSEPETQAMRSLFERIGDRAAFYLSAHTPSHAVIAPWAAYQAPFPIPGNHSEVLEAELGWIRDHTEYEAGKAAWGNLSAGLPYSASGSSMDYYYAHLHRPAFTVEVEYWAASATASDYPARLLQQYQGLRYWMDATLPIPMHMLANAKELSTWQSPVAASLAPELTTGEHPAWPREVRDEPVAFQLD